MDSLNVIGIAKRNSGLKSWYLRHSLIGKRILRTALESQYGKQEQVLENGVRKFVKETCSENGSKNTVTTYVEPKKLTNFRTTLRGYDAEGNRTTFSSFAKDPNDKHRKVSVQITDMPKLGRRDYTYTVMRYDLNTYTWVMDSVDKKTFKRTEAGKIDVKSIHKDGPSKTNIAESKTITMPHVKKQSV